MSNTVAVIDVGSNSIRLVVYELYQSTAVPIFNEKKLCGLARDMETTGTLHVEGCVMAKAAMARFVRLLEVMEVSEVHVLATSAVRDAQDGPAFVSELKRLYGVEVAVLSGEHEARLAGYGVLSSIERPEGVVADLGGGSLELAGVQAHDVVHEQSFPVGPLRVLKADQSVSQRRVLLDQSLQHFPLREAVAGKTLYLVGGVFRNFAKVHMDRVDYPLQVTHYYQDALDRLLSTAEVVARMSAKALVRLDVVPSKRSEFLPYGALVLQRLVHLGQPKAVVFSASGIREGFLYSTLSRKMQAQDSLLSGVAAMNRQVHRTPDYGYELAAWVAPLFDSYAPDFERLCLAAAILSELSLYENASYRADLAFNRVLDSSLMGIDHEERVFIALALYYRYAGQRTMKGKKSLLSLVSVELRQRARVLGLAMRLARRLCGSVAGMLPHTSLTVRNDTLVLRLPSRYEDLASSVVKRSFSGLAEILDLEPVIRVG